MCSGEMHVGYDMRQADCFRWLYMRLEGPRIYFCDVRGSTRFSVLW
jgi:hypothetical protein